MGAICLQRVSVSWKQTPLSIRCLLPKLSHLQVHWRLYRYLDLSVPCPVRAQGWFSFPQRVVPEDLKCREMSLRLFLFAEFWITAVLYSLFGGSFIKSSLKWRDHFYNLHGLGNQTVDLPEKFPISEAVKSYLSDVIKRVWHTERAREFWEEAAALQKNMKGRARIHFRRILELSGQERSWQEIPVHKYGNNRSEVVIKCSKWM